MKKDICAQFLCKDCEDFDRCQYYHSRKEDSYICKYFHLSDKLDKIRDEIEHLHDWAFTREEVLRIIDKYKAESEGKEWSNDKRRRSDRRN